MKLYFAIGLIFISSYAYANVVGTDAQNFNTISSGLDFITVQSSETLEPGILNIGVFTNYAENTFSYLGSSDRKDYKDGMITADTNFGIGLLRNWDAGVSFPWLISAWDNSQLDRVQLKDQGLTQVRVNTKYRLTGDRNGGVAVIGSVGFDLIDNNPYAGEGAGPTYNLEFAADTTLGKVALGGNLGYRMRTPGRKIAQFPIDPLKDQVIGSVAASYLIPDWDTKIIGEVYGSWPTQKITEATDRTQTTFEFIAGLKHDATPRLALHAGGGTKLANGIASPDWRVYVGLNYVIGPLFGQPKAYIQKVKPGFNYDDAGPGTRVAPFWEEPVETSETFVAGDILFGFNSDRVVQKGAREALAQLSEHVQRPPRYLLVVIEGHTDSIGADSYNLDLSQRRANTIKKHLTEIHGLDPKRVLSIGYGESRPIADNGNYQGRAKNRRVEFQVYREGSEIPREYRRLMSR